MLEDLQKRLDLINFDKEDKGDKVKKVIGEAITKMYNKNPKKKKQVSKLAKITHKMLDKIENAEEIVNKPIEAANNVLRIAIKKLRKSNSKTKKAKDFLTGETIKNKSLLDIIESGYDKYTSFIKDCIKLADGKTVSDKAEFDKIIEDTCTELRKGLKIKEYIDDFSDFWNTEYVQNALDKAKLSDFKQLSTVTKLVNLLNKTNTIQVDKKKLNEYFKVFNKMFNALVEPITNTTKKCEMKLKIIFLFRLQFRVHNASNLGTYFTKLESKPVHFLTKDLLNDN